MRIDNFQCSKAVSVFPGKVILKANTAAFMVIQNTYWSDNARDIEPACFIQPKTTQDVSKIVAHLTTPDNIECRFAIKSGGHTFWAGAANLQGGITMDLSKLNQIDIAADKKIAKIGPGNRWGAVFEAVEKEGMAVAGGRMSSVGVGGLLTGGGLSFFQPFGGFSCDGILNHEVVLANGSIVNANRNENPDLHRALKGGGNNFGIVTRFDLHMFPKPKLWGGIFLAMDQRKKALDWLVEGSISNNDTNTMVAVSMLTPTTTLSLAVDPDVNRQPVLMEKANEMAVITNRSMAGWFGTAVVNSTAVGRPSRIGISGIPTSIYTTMKAFFSSLKDGPNTLTTAATNSSSLPGMQLQPGKFYALTSPAGIAGILGSAAETGFRLHFFSWNIKVSKTATAPYLEALTDLHKSEGAKLPLFSNPSIFFQPITSRMRHAGEAIGGPNAMGLKELLGDDDLILVAVGVRYWFKSDGDKVVKWAKEFTKMGKNMAEEKGVGSPWQYVNYSDGWQDAMGTYGKEAREFLKGISRRYDPRGTFQKQVPGGFKLGM
ncbi:FAD-binding domain-containing protein [Microthyrium microscopicum]|uniref:FAD-binding domain-containing protein n=1 Tax=Microthyrium microscopicum TaxID=703497 RepID=A0A6A6TVN0_9PEZI|nr:FAD-binding domain-containing protein [Microthyrium microscopicum]